jgi:SWIM zinc finger
MITLKNFEKHVGADIFKKGKKYFENGHVSNIEEVSDGNWNAEVEGTDKYEVEIEIINDNTVNDYFCDCPYEGEMCKHIVAVLFELRSTIKMEAKSTTKTKKVDVFETLLQTLTKKDFENFIKDYSTKNKDVKNAFELFFAEKDSRIDVVKKYDEIVKKLIRNNTHSYGFLESNKVYKELNLILKNGQALVSKNNCKDAFAIAKAILRPIMDTVANNDDSDGYISSIIENTAELLHNIITNNQTAIDLKETIFIYLQNELKDKIYFDYGDIGYCVFSVYKDLAVQLKNATMFLNFIDEKVKTLIGEYDNYEKEYFQKSKISFLREIGKVEDADKLVLENIDIVEVRMELVNVAIKKKKYDEAKRLIAEGIIVAEKKEHPGTVSVWEKELLRIAQIENDVLTVRKFTKYFTFDRGFSSEYYEQWKQSYKQQEWAAIIEIEIKAITKKVTEEWETRKHKMWNPTNYPPLLQYLAPIYIQEKYWDRLFVLVQQVNELDTTLKYQQYLIKDYKKELIKIYIPALEEHGKKTNDRNSYHDLANKMKIIIKTIPESKDKVIEVAKKLIQMFSVKPRRPAMIEELSRVF